MRYVIYPLHFTTPVHFGTAELGGKLEQIGISYSSDSLFSALCWELRQLGEIEYLQTFCQNIRNGTILFSDLFPYTVMGQNQQYAFYLPKPIFLNSTFYVKPAATLQDVRRQATEQKKQKKLKYIRASELKACFTALRKGSSYAPAVSLGEQELIERVNCRGEEPLPYYVGTYTFRHDAGLYGIMQYEEDSDEALLYHVFQALGMTGIGGKRSSGLGKFTIDKPLYIDSESGTHGDDGSLYSMLRDTNASKQMSLSSIIPQNIELPVVAEGNYTLRCRSGFTMSEGVLKKRNSVYAIAAGACFSKRLDGQVVVLDDTVKPPIWRNGKGLFVGLPV